MFVAVTWLPDAVTVAFHAWVTRWPDGNVHPRFQPVMGSPRFVTATFPVKPPGHCAGTVYATRQPAAAWVLTATATPAVNRAATAPAAVPASQRVRRTRCRFSMTITYPVTEKELVTKSRPPAADVISYPNWT